MKNLIILLSTVISFLSTEICEQTPAIKVTKISGSGTPMLFLPHIGCSSNMWKQIADHYSKSHACYLVDFAGFNTMPEIEISHTGKYISALSNYIKENKLRNPILIGQNYGGYIAIKTAENKTLDIKAIVASDFYPKLSMVLDSAMTKEKLMIVTESMKRSILESDSLTFASYQKQIGQGMNLMDSIKVADFIKWQVNSDRNTLAETLTDQLEDDLIPTLQQNKIPLLVYNTWYFAKKYQNKPLLDATETMKKMFPKAQNITFAITEDAKDFMAMDLPDWFINELDSFLMKIEK